MSRKKITVLGAGPVGAACAQRLAERDYANVVLLSAEEGLARARAGDVNDGGPVAGYEPRVTGTTNYEETTGSDLCVIASGSARHRGRSSDERVAADAESLASATRQFVERSPNATIIVATDPLEALCHVVLGTSELPRARVIGTAAVLDTARLRALCARELGVSVRDVSALVLGGGGELVPVMSAATVSGASVADRIGSERLLELVGLAREAGAERSALVDSDPASGAPSAAVAEIADAILLDRRRVLPCSAYCQGEYGIENTYVGVPCALGQAGIEEIVEVELSEGERAALHRAASAVRDIAGSMGRAGGS